MANSSVTKGFDYQAPFVNPEIMEQTAVLVNEIFEHLQGIYPTFRQSWPTQTEVDLAKRQWVMAFMESKLIDIDQIAIGLIRCRESEEVWFPSPGKFIKYCVEGLGFPLMEEAWDEVRCQIHNTRKEFSHPTIEAAYMLTGSWDLKNKPEKEAKAIFINHFQGAKQRFVNGENLEKLPPHSRFPDNKSVDHLPPMPASISEFIGNLDRIQEEKTGKPIEPLNYDDVVVDSSRFHELTSYEKAMPVIKKILGMK